jgi:hypothetical protein
MYHAIAISEDDIEGNRSIPTSQETENDISPSENSKADRESVEQAISTLQTKPNTVKINISAKRGSSPYSDPKNSPSPPQGKQWIFV